jgi:hypothetical protein
MFHRNPVVFSSAAVFLLLKAHVLLCKKNRSVAHALIDRACSYESAQLNSWLLITAPIIVCGARVPIRHAPRTLLMPAPWPPSHTPLMRECRELGLAIQGKCVIAHAPRVASVPCAVCADEDGFASAP